MRLEGNRQICTAAAFLRLYTSLGLLQCVSAASQAVSLSCAEVKDIQRL